MTLDTALLDAEFPGAREQTYFNCAARGLVPQSARRAVDTMLDSLSEGSGDKAAMFDSIDDVRSGFARMINAAPDEIAMIKNVSEGLNIIAAALDLQSDDNVILCPELEHPNNVYPWLHLRERLGVEIRAIEGQDGHMPISEMIDAMDDRTRCVSVASVSFSPGFRSDIAPLGQACRDRGVFHLVDAVQSVGILETDVEALQIDALSVSTQKGLLGLYGMGMLYCRRGWAQRLTPAYLARLGVDLGDEAHEADLGSDNYRLMPDARRFDLGNHNYVGAIAADAALKLLNGIGTAAIEAHVTALAEKLASGFIDLGLPVAGGASGAHIGSIVCVGRHGAGGHDTTDDTEIAELSAHLTENGVQHSIRRGLIRLSLHVYNTEEDVERTLALAADWRSARRAA